MSSPPESDLSAFFLVDAPRAQSLPFGGIERFRITPKDSIRRVPLEQIAVVG